MTGQGGLSRKPQSRLRAILIAQTIWIALVCVLGGWWASLAWRQAETIRDLRVQAGIPADQIADQWARTQRMLLWESGTFLALVLGITALLFWFYWQEIRRARGLQAFFASVTHELRTPLTSIRLQAESIADSPSSDPASGELVKRLLEDTMRLESQVERTLELARVEGGGPLFTESLRLRPSLERMLGNWKEAHGGRIEIQSAIEDVTAQADHSAIGVILRNLLENSIRHSGQDSLRIMVSAKPSRDGVELNYRDNGRGFAGNPDELGKLFARGPDSQGAGVGLYLVRALMERMGGKARFSGGAGFEASLWFREGSADGR